MNCLIEFVVLVVEVLVFLCDHSLFIMITKIIAINRTAMIIEVTTIPVVTEPVITPTCMIVIKC